MSERRTTRSGNSKKHPGNIQHIADKEGAEAEKAALNQLKKDADEKTKAKRREAILAVAAFEEAEHNSKKRPATPTPLTLGVDNWGGHSISTEAEMDVDGAEEEIFRKSSLNNIRFALFLTSQIRDFDQT